MTDVMTPATRAHYDHEAIITMVMEALPGDITADVARAAAESAALTIAAAAAYAENDRRTADDRVAAAVSACTVPFRSVTRRAGVGAACHSINHSDSGEIVRHDRCGAEVVVRDDGRIFDVILVGSYQARKFQCFRGQHRCRAADVASAEARRAQAAESGEIVKGCTVVVARGRKVAKGTTGEVFWLGDKGYGLTVGLRTADGVTHFTAAKNCDRA